MWSSLQGFWYCQHCFLIKLTECGYIFSFHQLATQVEKKMLSKNVNGLMLNCEIVLDIDAGP